MLHFRRCISKISGQFLAQAPYHNQRLIPLPEDGTVALQMRITWPVHIFNAVVAFVGSTSLAKDGEVRSLSKPSGLLGWWVSFSQFLALHVQDQPLLYSTLAQVLRSTAKGERLYGMDSAWLLISLLRISIQCLRLCQLDEAWSLWSKPLWYDGSIKNACLLVSWRFCTIVTSQLVSWRFCTIVISQWLDGGGSKCWRHYVFCCAKSYSILPDLIPRLPEPLIEFMVTCGRKGLHILIH